MYVYVFTTLQRSERRKKYNVKYTLSDILVK